MDITDWQEDMKRRFKNDSSLLAIDFIAGIVVDDLQTTVPPVTTVKIIESDSGTLIAWKHGKTIDHFLSPQPAEILVRGEERWPSGHTRKNDSLLAIADAELRGNKAQADRLLRRFLDTGPIATRRREDRIFKRDKKRIRIRKPVR